MVFDRLRRVKRALLGGPRLAPRSGAAHVAREDLRDGLPDALDAFQVRRDERLVEAALFTDLDRDFLGHPAAAVAVDPDPVFREAVDRFVERRDLGPGKTWVFLHAGVQGAQFVERHFRDGAGAVGRPVHRPVVHDDQLAGLAALHVELDHGGPFFRSSDKGRDSILREASIIAPVRANAVRRHLRDRGKSEKKQKKK